MTDNKYGSWPQVLDATYLSTDRYRAARSRFMMMGGVGPDGLALPLSLDGGGMVIGGGSSAFRSLDVDESAEQIKASSGSIYWIHCINLASAALFLKFYNAPSASVIVGTTTPLFTFPVPTQGNSNGAGFNLAPPTGIAFSTGITVACTTGIADNNTTGPGANECVLNLGYS